MRRFRKKRTIRIIPLLLTVCTIFLLALIPLALNSNFFLVKSIDVKMDKINCIDSDKVKQSSNLLGQNLFLINSAKVEENLKRKFICIKSVTTSRYFPSTIKLDIFGREPIAILVVLKNEEATPSNQLENFTEIQSTPSAESSSSATFDFSVNDTNENFVVDDEGLIYSNSIEQINVPRVYTSGLSLFLGQRVKGDLIENTLKILQKVGTFGVDVKDAKIYSEKILLINAIPKIIFRMDEKIDAQIASLQLILNKAKIDNGSLEFIDLRFDKPIVRFAPKKN